MGFHLIHFCVIFAILCSFNFQNDCINNVLVSANNFLKTDSSSSFINNFFAKKYGQHENFHQTSKKENSKIRSNVMKEYLESDKLQAFKKQNEKKHCPSCVYNDYSSELQEELSKQRLEYIKLQILHKLGMNSAPKLRKNIDINSCKSLSSVNMFILN